MIIIIENTDQIINFDHVMDIGMTSKVRKEQIEVIDGIETKKYTAFEMTSGKINWLKIPISEVRKAIQNAVSTGDKCLILTEYE